MPDPEDDPISFDFAMEEMAEAENETQKADKEAMKLAQEEMAKKAMAPHSRLSRAMPWAKRRGYNFDP